MTACSLDVFCNVEKFLCSPHPWGKGGRSDLNRSGRVEEPNPSDVLISRGEESAVDPGGCSFLIFVLRPKENFLRMATV